jgi:single-stranded-DNA-specific exonuclease
MTKPCSQTPWSLLPADPAVVDSLASATGLSRTTSRVFVARGISTAEQVEHFLSPSLDRDWLSPSLIPGMAAAAERVAAAVRGGEQIVVFGDFDLDGVSASAVAARGLAAMGATVTAIVPHRFKEGYACRRPPSSGSCCSSRTSLSPSTAAFPPDPRSRCSPSTPSTS